MDNDIRNCLQLCYRSWIKSFDLQNMHLLELNPFLNNVIGIHLLN